MNFDWFHATQMEESDNHALFFECKRRHFSIKNTTATRPLHKHSTGSTVLPLGLALPKEQPCLLQQLSRFYLLPFPRKKLGYLTTWTSHVLGSDGLNAGYKDGVSIANNFGCPKAKTITIMCCQHRRPREVIMFHVLPMVPIYAALSVFKLSFFVKNIF